jgi:hypothetical protein
MERFLTVHGSADRWVAPFNRKTANWAHSIFVPNTTVRRSKTSVSSAGSQWSEVSSLLPEELEEIEEYEKVCGEGLSPCHP